MRRERRRKSTLIKTLSGIYPHGSYTGDLKVDGRVAAFRGIKDSERAGISVIHQELSVIKELSVAENVFLGNEPARFGVVKRAELRERTKALLAEVGLAVPPETLVGELGVGQQQLVE